ncbi:hypothetical protein PENANT_c043G03439 [Penicillium antarcticum]|uniref:TauD/TfdA-like domain-containing protein n=1 Tax=Penicillium antarcticum TaxID=416450 RepID=A0A1V6PSE5_9EURO|nr:uncharacterized protein N7508_002629 [Penicillium antarcticum]KAJ5318121.1 hypothetical protein N7508_002629 [Penicillium antarcticum]OQD79851.1 hypothetical protein PENANT_c043G03439 [Penicillium antarcticum]
MHSLKRVFPSRLVYGRHHLGLYSSFGIVRRGQNFATVSQTVPHLQVPDISFAENPDHVRKVSDQLQKDGILKIGLGFGDDDSNYLQKLIVSLHKQHGHRLPISHSASCGWFWDVRPNTTTFQSHNHQARSETMEDFPWHTDCSYEEPPPRFFALQVLQHDRCGGGTLSVLNVKRLCESLSPTTRSALQKPEYRITIPTEFIKNPDQQDIIGNILSSSTGGDQPDMMRYRGEIISPMSEAAAAALQELEQSLRHEKGNWVVHLTPEILPKRSIILLDNRLWLHARNSINDPERHLRRVRWDASPFMSLSN